MCLGVLSFAFTMRLLAFACQEHAFGAPWACFGALGGCPGSYFGIVVGALRVPKSDACCTLCKNMLLHAFSKLAKRKSMILLKLSLILSVAGLSGTRGRQVESELEAIYTSRHLISSTIYTYVCCDV